MNAEVIGTWAGQVWNALNESGKLTVKGLKKATKLKEKELYADRKSTRLNSSHSH